jgi:hypothetical protein
MNWKDNGSGSVARAAREVGGRYWITRNPGGPTWYGEIQATSYRVEYLAKGDNNWRDIRYPRGAPGTLAEAKRMAEEDHERRRREVSK